MEFQKRTGETIRKTTFMLEPTIHNVSEHPEFYAYDGEDEANLGGDKDKKESL